MKDLCNQELRLLAISLTMFKSFTIECSGAKADTAPISDLLTKVTDELVQREKITAMAEMTLELPFPLREKRKFIEIPDAPWSPK